MASTLKNGALRANPEWTAELDVMLENDAKTEIEALYTIVGLDGLCEALVQQIFQGQYLC